ncbi:MAG: cation:proton antiporter, partial [Aeromonas sp.]
ELMKWQYWAYAVASLTVLRIVPVWISLMGTGLKPELKLFIGWFGPRGLASIVFAVMVLQNRPALLGQDPIIATVLCTIILSVLLHGLSANPWVARFKTAKHTAN